MRPASVVGPLGAGADGGGAAAGFFRDIGFFFADLACGDGAAGVSPAQSRRTALHQRTGITFAEQVRIVMSKGA